MSKEDDSAILLEFLQQNPDQFSSRIRRNRPEPTTLIGQNAIREIIGRAYDKPAIPSTPGTVPDRAVRIILEAYYDVPEVRLEDMERDHQFSMAAENIVGELLERYIAVTSDDNGCGWVRAWGNVIKHVDFIKRDRNSWNRLQIKNRNNSENAASSSVRDGTDIQMWFRSNSRTGGTNWANFPDPNLGQHLSEEKFEEFVRGYLLGIREVSKKL